MISAKSFGYEVHRSYKNYDLVKCRYHNDKNPSALFFKDTLVFKCLSCGAFVNHSDDPNVDFDEIEEPTFNLYKDPVNYMGGLKVNYSPEVERYLTKRNVAIETALEYGVMELDKIVAFPQIDLTGNVTGRVLRETEKGQLNQRYKIEGHRSPLWPLNKVDGVKPTFVSEGAFKALNVAQAANELKGRWQYNSVATMGSYWSKQLKETVLQFPEKFILLADNDKAGLRLAERFKESGCRVFKVKRPFDELDFDKQLIQLGGIIDKLESKNAFRLISKSLGKEE